MACRRRVGMTLTEVLAVVAVLALLVSALLGYVGRAGQKSRRAVERLGTALSAEEAANEKLLEDTRQ